MQVQSEAGFNGTTKAADRSVGVSVVTASEWIDRVSAQLQKRWPTIDPARLDDLASDLWTDERLRAMSPDAAAADWLEPVSSRR